MRLRRGSSWPAAIVLTVALIMVGCGLRGDPKPPQVKAPPPIADLKAVSNPEGILLSWTVTDLVKNVGSFKILRSMTLDGSLACPECPQDYQPFATASINDASLSREGEKGFKYFDATVRDGSYYSYRIQVCSLSGQCAEASNEAGLIYRKGSGARDKGPDKGPEKGLPPSAPSSAP
ncbi:MAG: hypothetical protein LLG93_13805 [Deltaproteobacteria bacterium]|nr:hypothetical protein [Deltaproteobacteria bacterium]